MKLIFFLIAFLIGCILYIVTNSYNFLTIEHFNDLQVNRCNNRTTTITECLPNHIIYRKNSDCSTPTGCLNVTTGVVDSTLPKTKSCERSS